MKIKYEFVNETVEIDGAEEWANIVIDCDRCEYNNDHKETRRHNSLDAYEFEGDVFGAEDENINAIFEDTEMIDKLHIAMAHLSEKQKALIKAIYFDNMKARDYAVRMGVSKAAISQQLKTALKKLKKYF